MNDNGAPDKERPSTPLADSPKIESQGDRSANIAEIDDFGLPVRPPSRAYPKPSDDDSGNESDTFHDAEDMNNDHGRSAIEGRDGSSLNNDGKHEASVQSTEEEACQERDGQQKSRKLSGSEMQTERHDKEEASETEVATQDEKVTQDASNISTSEPALEMEPRSPVKTKILRQSSASLVKKGDRRNITPAISEWSHQSLAPRPPESEEEEEEEEWQAMPALGDFDVYDDEGRIIAKAVKPEDEDEAGYNALGGAGSGYTRVQLDEDAQSATSMDDETNYLFNQVQKSNSVEEEEQRDALAQLQATKDLLTEGQRIAYVGVTRLTIVNMVRFLKETEGTKASKKSITKALESTEKWGQQIMVRLYSHMDIDSAEQIMIEQLADHGVQPTDMVPLLMRNSRIKNPMADRGVELKADDEKTGRASVHSQGPTAAESLPLQQDDATGGVPAVHSPQDMPRTEKIDLDIRWTVLCDLFLVLIADSIYDARSRCLLEQVASAMDISWVQICRFEKRVIDALEMQEETTKENWDEAEHLENRRKLGLKRKYMVMGLATVGGGLIIGLSAGLLAPVIGAGLAAGFTTIGVTGTAGFLGGVGGAALITSAATAAGGTIAVRASNRRTGHVKTFEYRPLHNNKRLNLILTISGWMTGNVDDVRLPYSTVDPIMGDIYSLLWEPEMLQSMGDTINILATEALTQTVQQVLGSTILVALMASIQLPVVLTKLSYLIDNPWTVSLDRANAAGLILADSLIDRHLGQRPITLVGFSLGSRLIFSCLKELASRNAYGLIQNVYLFGSPIVANKDEYLRASTIVSGRFVNGYASNDWILGYLFRATSGGIMQVAGLGPVEGIPGLENIDVTKLVNGHMAYRASMPRLLREVGWEVESDEFSEIEDPDPENHAKRQRELIQEIDDARLKAESKPGKRRFGFFKKGKLAEKSRTGWEVYDAKEKRWSGESGHGRANSESSGRESPGLEANVLFDIDAIRRELESEMIEVRELSTTLPPMQISTLPDGEKKESFLAVPEEYPTMKLPPRPDEIDEHGRIISNGAKLDDFEFPAPRELESTLPPLQLSPSLPQDAFRPTPAVSEVLSHAHSPELENKEWTAPVAENPKLDFQREATPAVQLDRNGPAVGLDHNAWADEEPDYREQEFTMTFE